VNRAETVFPLRLIGWFPHPASFRWRQLCHDDFRFVFSDDDGSLEVQALFNVGTNNVTSLFRVEALTARAAYAQLRKRDCALCGNSGRLHPSLTSLTTPASPPNPRRHRGNYGDSHCVCVPRRLVDVGQRLPLCVVDLCADRIQDNFVSWECYRGARAALRQGFELELRGCQAYTAEALAGADLCIVNPVMSATPLSDEEIEAVYSFAKAGGTVLLNVFSQAPPRRATYPCWLTVA
jgi:hypothetical protein